MVLKRIAVGVSLFVLAGVLMVAPEMSPSVPTATPLLFALGLVIVGLGLRYLRPKRGASEASPPVPEGPAELPAPGKDIESQLQTLSTSPLRPNAKKQWREAREELQTQLRALTVSTLTERYNLSTEEANAMLDAGSWSENPHAVAFFTGRYPDWTPSRISLRQKRLSSRSDVSKQAAHVIDELGAIEHGERMLSEGALTGAEEPGSTRRQEPTDPGREDGEARDSAGGSI